VVVFAVIVMRKLSKKEKRKCLGTLIPKSHTNKDKGGKGK